MKYLKKPKYPPEQVTDEIRQTVSTILSDVEQNGVTAVRKYSERFDNWSPESFRVS
jgi:sulfopropanediol 3-dehydrogenase